MRRSSGDRRPERDDLRSAVRAIARKLVGQDATQTLADQVDRLVAALGEREHALSYLRQECRDVSTVAAEAPALDLVAEPAQEAAQRQG